MIHHFCLYFELGCELGPSEAQAQNTSKNDDFKNGPLFDLIFTWELILDTYRGLGYAQFGWSIFLNRWWLLKRCGRCFQPEEGPSRGLLWDCKTLRNLLQLLF